MDPSYCPLVMTQADEPFQDLASPMDMPQTNSKSEISLQWTRSSKVEPFTGFLDLPFELRMIIYQYSLISSMPLEVSISTSKPLPKKSNRANFLATCKQIHAEATPILYGRNSFAIIRTQEPLADIKSIPCSLVRRLRVSFHHTFNQRLTRLSTRWRQLSADATTLAMTFPNLESLALELPYHQTDVNMLYRHTWDDLLLQPEAASKEGWTSELKLRLEGMIEVYGGFPRCAEVEFRVEEGGLLEGHDLEAFSAVFKETRSHKRIMTMER